MSDAPARPVPARPRADRLERIRERIRSGYYDSPAAIDALARSLLDRRILISR